MGSKPEEPFDEADLDETAAGLDDTVDDIELEEGLDEIDGEESEGQEVFGDYDPELHKRRLATTKQSTAVVMNDTTQFILGTLSGLVGLGLVIYAVTVQTTNAFIAMGLISTPCLFYFVLRWKRWVGSVPHVVRLMISLGETEDAKIEMERHEKKQQAKLEAKIRKMEAQQAREQGEAS